MSSTTASLFFFGAQTQPVQVFREQLGSLRRRATTLTPHLYTFARQTLDGVVGGGHDNQVVEWAHTLASLSQLDGDGGGDAVSSAVVPCVAQLGSLVWKCQQDERILGGRGSDECAQRVFVGQCSGLVIACGAAAAADAGQLVQLSAELLGIVRRLTVFAMQRSHEVEDSPGHSWALAVRLTGGQCVDLIRRCREHGTLPGHKRAYVSFESDEWSTISGPPSTLRLLVASSETLAETPRRQLPIFAAYHAPHLREPRYDALLGSSPLLDVPMRAGVHVLSSSTGAPFDGRSLRDVLLQALPDILQHPLCLSRIVEEVGGRFKAAGVKPVMQVFGPRAQWAGFADELKDKGVYVRTIEPALGCGQTNKGDSGGDGDARDDIEDTEDDNDDDLIAITGFSGRFPGANSTDELWDLLCSGRDTSGYMPRERLGDHFTGCVPTGCFLHRPGAFDSRFFDMSRRAALQTDPAQRLLLVTTQEALDMAGHASNARHSVRHVGTFIGQATDDWREHNMDHGDAYYVTGGLRAFGPGRLNHFFGWDGPSLSVDTACSSSAVAIDIAVQALRARRCDMAVAGGVSIVTGGADEGLHAGLGRGGFLGAPGTACKTFDALADGYTRGEAVAVVVLKRLGDARRDGDTVHGLIRGVATNHSTDTHPITRPSPAAQQALLRQVLHEAQRRPADVAYVEVHGSGTQAGDRAEVEAVAAVLGGAHRRLNTLRLGSVKANVGHGEGAAGITAVVKALLMLGHDLVPPNIGLRTAPNPHFPQLDEANMRINLTAEPLRLDDGGRARPPAIVVNCFGAAGGNTTILLEAPRHKLKAGVEPRVTQQHSAQKHHIVTVSAKSQSALRANKLGLLKFLDQQARVDIADLAYTTCARRTHYALRCAYVARDTADIFAQLRKDIEAGHPPSPSHEPPTKRPQTQKSQVVFVFPGQGGWTAGAAQPLFASSTVFRDALCDYAGLSEALGFPGVLAHLTSPTTGEDDDAHNDENTDLALRQVALVVLELALSSFWQALGVLPQAVLGHSLGEYAALHVAGVLSASDALWLVGQRARLVEQTCEPGVGRMLAVFAPEPSLAPFITATAARAGGQGDLEVACWNTPSQTVVAGPLDSLVALQGRLREEGIKSVLIGTRYAYHTSQMDKALGRLRDAAAAVSFVSRPRVRFLSTVTGSAVDSCPSWSEYIVRHTREPVRFTAAVQSALVELAPGRTSRTTFLALSHTRGCRDMVAANIAAARDELGDGGAAEDVCVLQGMLAGSSHGHCLDTIASSLAHAYISGVDVDWARYHLDQGFKARLLQLPAYAFVLEDFWIPHKPPRRLGAKPLPSPSLTPPPPAKPPALTKKRDTAVTTSALDQSGSQGSTLAVRHSDLEQEPLRSLVVGHAVRRKPICPAGVLVDLAFRAALRTLGRQVGLDSVQLRSLSLLVPVSMDNANGAASGARRSHMLTTSVEGHKGRTASELVVAFRSGHHCRTLHATCIVQMRKEESLVGGSTTMTTNMLLRALSRMARLRADSVSANHFTRSMVYRMWASVMNYAPEYHLLKNLAMVSNGYEAAATMSVDTAQGDGAEFVTDPLWIDGVMQVAGFTVNMNMTPAGSVVSTVWILAECGSVTFWERPHRHEVYACYASGGPDEATGDIIMSVYVFAEDHDMRLTAAVEGMRFHRLDGKHAETSNRGSTTAVRVPLVHSDTAVPGPGQPQVLDRLIRVLARETLADPGEISERTAMTDLGIDSLLTASVAESIGAELGIQVPLLAFQQAETVGQLGALCRTLLVVPETSMPALAGDGVDSAPSSRATLLSRGHLGSHGVPESILFLLPDASGSSAAYAGLPPGLSAETGLTVFALESPFYGVMAGPTPRCSMADYCALFVEAIRRIQPTGPYMLGGWSIGGRIAYECARQLLRQGHAVAGLLLVESYAHLVPRLHAGSVSVADLEATGFFAWAGTGPVAEWQRQHILDLILLNSEYDPPPLCCAEDGGSETRPVPVQLVWSANGDFALFPAKVLQATGESVGTGVGDDDGDNREWLEEPRCETVVARHTEEWQRVAGCFTQWRVQAVEGGHFDIVLPKVRPDMAQVLAEAVRWFLRSDS